MAAADKRLVILSGDIRTPPLGIEARREAGFLLRRLQQGETLDMPHSRPMPAIGRRVSELRVRDSETSKTWRIIYRADTDLVIVVDVFAKQTRATPKKVIDTCKKRLADVDRSSGKRAKE